jgi:hypothetical protein
VWSRRRGRGGGGIGRGREVLTEECEGIRVEYGDCVRGACLWCEGRVAMAEGGGREAGLRRR